MTRRNGPAFLEATLVVLFAGILAALGAQALADDEPEGWKCCGKDLPADQATCACGKTRPEPAGDGGGAGGGASSPKECVALLCDAAAKKDMKAVCGCMADPWGPAIWKMWEGAQAAEVSKKKLADAVDEKYGAGTSKECGLSPMTMEDMPMKKAELVECKEEGDRAKGKIKEEGKEKLEDVEFVKQDGGWKMLPEPGAKPEDAREMEKMGEKMPKISTVYEQLAKDVEAGKYATKQDFQMAYGMAMMEVFK